MAKRKDITVVLRIDDKERVIKLNNADAHVKKLQHSLDNVNAKKLGGVFNGIDLSLKNIVTSMGLAFGASQIMSLAKESVQLAMKTEGVRAAFLRINDPTLLDNLRKATKGTVTDLTLMTNVIKARNFQISLENLPTFFRFAQQRARETGESVKFLVDSIILGIGRKSPLILDNLGISAIRLREKFKGVGVETASVGDVSRAVGEIINEELQKMGAGVDLVADKWDSYQVRIQNLELTIGQVLLPTVRELLGALTDIDNIIGSGDGTGLGEILSVYIKEVIGAIPTNYLRLAKYIKENENVSTVLANTWKKDAIFGNAGMSDGLTSLGDLADQLKIQRLDLEKEINAGNKANWTAQNKTREKIKEKIKELNEALDQTVPGTPESKNIENQISSLEKLIKVTKAASDANNKQADLRKELAVKLQSGMDAELVKLKQWYDEKLLIAAGDKDLQLMLEKSYWIQRNEIIGKATKGLDELIRMYDKKSVLLDRYRRTGKVYYEDNEVPHKEVDKPDPLGYVDIAEQEQQLWEDTHFIAMSVMDGVRAASRTMWSEFIIGGRQAKDGWDAIWLSMRNTALQSIGDILTTGIFDYLRGAGKASKAGGNGKGNIFTDIFSFLSSFIPFLGEGGVVTKPTLAVVGDKKEAIIPLNRMNQFNFGQAADISRLVNKMDELKFAFTDKQWQLDMRKMYTVQKKINTNYNKRKV
ncbi:MAG: hypothetical protein NUV65_05935 [Candidatus Roizmanbacteria bacterium]|nr:hypothetical protein [Candidatus Roizmanbacteria bacterium]